MSYVIATPEMMATAAFDLARIGSQVSAASAVAAMPTTEVVAAGADEVSAGIAALFSAHAQEYQALSAQAAAFHDQFVHTLTAAARWYTATEIANAAAMRVVLGAVNAPTQMAATALPVPSGRWAAPAGRPGYLGSAAPVARAGRAHPEVPAGRVDGWRVGAASAVWVGLVVAPAGRVATRACSATAAPVVPVGLVVAPAARAVTRGGLVMGALAAWVV